MKRDLQSRVEAAMQSLDGLERAEATPYLWSKIKTRLETATNALPQQVAWRMVMALSVIVVVNLFTLFNAGKSDSKPQSGPELIANEYSLNLPQSY